MNLNFALFILLSGAVFGFFYGLANLIAFRRAGGDPIKILERNAGLDAADSPKRKALIGFAVFMGGLAIMLTITYFNGPAKPFA